jgi:hypothetical protein
MTRRNRNPHIGDAERSARAYPARETEEALAKAAETGLGPDQAPLCEKAAFAVTRPVLDLTTRFVMVLVYDINLLEEMCLVLWRRKQSFGTPVPTYHAALMSVP